MSAARYGQCLVCARQLSEPREYGGRRYCPAHLAMFPEDQPHVWRASTLTFGVMVLLVAVLGVVNGILLGASTEGRDPLIGAALALAPALTWLALLYRLAARKEVAISPLLPTLLVLGALVAAAVVRPLQLDLLRLDLWLSQTSALNRFVGNILLNGVGYAFALYALIRYTVWRTPAFTHRIDGIMYGLSAGWGYGSMLLLLAALDQSQISLLNGGLRILTRQCAFLAPSLVVGYFLGRNRFEDLPIVYLTSGLGIAALLNGVLLYAGTELNNIRLGIDQDGFSPWPGFVFSMAVLIATYAAVYGLTRRHNALTRARLAAEG